MALFFFHFFDGESLSTDETGIELLTTELAFVEAGTTALQMWPDLMAERINPLDCSFDIANARGEVMLRFDFSEMLDFGRSTAHRPSRPLEIMCRAIADTHQRAQQAKAELDASISETRKALDEAKTLLAQI